MQQELKAALKAAAKKLYGVEIEPELSRPGEQFGDYATNIALLLAKETNKNPRDVATALADEIDSPVLAAKPTVAGPGFINFQLKDKAIWESLAAKLPQKLAGQSIVVEYSDPNPFKVLHVGHLYTSTVGDAISNLFEAYGAKVHRVNFGGDVGLHVAKTMWAILQALGGEEPAKLAAVTDKPSWLSERYVIGNQAYDENETAKAEIGELNRRLYEIHEKNDQTAPLAKIYWTTRQWSYDYFDEFYKRIGSGFEKYYPESATAAPGLESVKANIGKVFEESGGAIVFKGEVHNMHTRVFINSQGLPTYETKDIGLALLKHKDYQYDRSIIITGNEQAEYMQVVLKALEQIEPELAQKTTHLTHGMVRLPGAQKMSSRLGNIVPAEEVLDMAKTANKQVNNSDDENVSLAAVKYAFLKQRIGADLVYDPAEAVSLEGNSGPYLQYAYVRARSLLAKVGSGGQVQTDLEPSERSLARKISEYPKVVEEATNELLPSHICTYLYELAQTFNRFYETSRVAGDPREAVRAKLVASYADVLKHGLGLLNITAPEKM